MGTSHRRTISPSPMSKYMPSRWERKHITKARKRFIALSPEERQTHGGSLVWVEPMKQTSKGRNIKRRKYKREKRLSQGIR